MTEIKTWKEAGFKIRKRQDRKKKPFQIYLGKVDGVRKFKHYKTLGDARAFCKRERIRLTNKGTQVLNISDRDRLDAVEARTLLGKVPLLEAVQFYLKYNPGEKAKTISELIPEYLTAPGKKGRNKSIKRRPDTVKGAQWRLAAFARAFGDNYLHEITESHILDWLDSNEWQGLNRKHYLANVSALYNFAIRRQYTSFDPTVRIEKPEIITSEPDILTPKQIESLLKAAVDQESTLVPRLAISFFAGLRPRELDRLQWENVSFENKLITVGKDIAKVQGHRRNVEMSKNLIAWLKPCRQESGNIWPYGSQTTLVRKRKKICEEAKVKMPYNAGRHAFASYHLAHHQNAALTAELMGHSNTNMLRNTYRNINTLDGKSITKTVAAKFWGILPKQ